jgi:hypothetical protein
MNSPHIDSYLESSISNYKTKSDEFKSKSIDELKNEINQILTEIYSKYYPEDKNILQIGNIGNVSQESPLILS